MEQLILRIPFNLYWKTKGKISKGCYSVLYSSSLSAGRLLSLSIEQILNTCVRSDESMLGHSQVSWHIHGPSYSITTERIYHAFLERKLISILKEDRTFKEEELLSRFYVFLNKSARNSYIAPLLIALRFLCIWIKMMRRKLRLSHRWCWMFIFSYICLINRSVGTYMSEELVASLFIRPRRWRKQLFRNISDDLLTNTASYPRRLTIHDNETNGMCP
jgi:hypothetical protein